MLLFHFFFFFFFFFGVIQYYRHQADHKRASLRFSRCCNFRFAIHSSMTINLINSLYFLLSIDVENANERWAEFEMSEKNKKFC